MQYEIRDGRLHLTGYVNAVERDSKEIMTKRGRCVEQIRSGAFAKSLERNPEVRMKLNHKRTVSADMTLREDNIGLHVEADTDDEEIMALAAKGELRGWSFGFEALDDEIEQRDGRTPRRIVKDLDLSEVSVLSVTPAYNGTSLEYRSEDVDGIKREIAYQKAVTCLAKHGIHVKPLKSCEYRCSDEDIEERYIPYHNPSNGQFTNGNGGGGGSVLVIPKNHKGVYQGFKGAMQKSMSTANDMVKERLGGDYSFQENGGLQMLAGQGTAQPTTTIDINTGNVTQQTGNVAPQATNSGNGLTNPNQSSTINTKPNIESKADGDCAKVIDICAKSGVKHNPVKDLDHSLTEQEIIDKIGGGDMTGGSCVSLAYAYAANKAGYDVLDFRGGKSRDVFSRSRYDMAGAVKATQSESIFGENTTPSKKLKILKSLPEGEEYVFRTGSHAAVVRNNGGVVQYLELQSSGRYGHSNGWHDMEKASDMVDRFGRRTKNDGFTLVNVKDVVKADGFKDMMGYINTEPNEQKKGASGYAK